MNRIEFLLDSTVERISFPHPVYTPTTTVLQYLRSRPDRRGTKEGCAEGDCGACTVVVAEPTSDGRLNYRAVDSCLLFLPMLHGKQLLTVESLGRSDRLHPVQDAMVRHHASQCGFCTPGFVMAMYALCRNHSRADRVVIDDALTGNLCRCTGYRPIVDAAANVCSRPIRDEWSRSEKTTAAKLRRMARAAVTIDTGPQIYYRPPILREALTFKHRNPEALIVTGATDVALRVTKRYERLRSILDLSACRELQKHSLRKKSITIGSGVPLNDVRDIVRDSFPALAAMLDVFGSAQIRNLATLGGNLGTASPIGDMLPLLIAYRAVIELRNPRRQRRVAIDDFITGYRKTVRHPNEIITAIHMTVPPRRVVVKSYKVSKRRDLDISTVSAGMRLERDAQGRVKDIVLAYGGMAAMTRRAKRCEAFLLGKKWSREIVETAMPILDVDFEPISDARSGAEFRSAAARNLLLKFWWESRARS